MNAELMKAKMFVCIREEGFPRAYPVAKLPDGEIRVVTWGEFDHVRAAQAMSNN